LFRSIAEWTEAAESRGSSLPVAILEAEEKETGAEGDQIRERIRETLAVMRAAVDEGLSSTEESPTGLTGGRAKRLAAGARRGWPRVGRACSARSFPRCCPARSRRWR
jgi:L-serine dehydratase